MLDSREIVVTGMGVVSPIGIGKTPFWDALRAGRSGVAPIQLFDNRHMPARFAGEIKDFDPKLYVKPRKSIKVMSREIQTGFTAASLAMQDAGLQKNAVDPARLGVVLGCEMLYGEVAELEEVHRSCLIDGRFDYNLFGETFPNSIYPLWLLKYLPNMAACHIAISCDARGPNNTVVLGDVSSLAAIAEATNVIQRDHADVVITGGTGSRIILTALMYKGNIKLSRRNDDPEAASRPFDRDRDGMVNGEGAAVLILESREHAQRRQANILGRVLSCGSSFNPKRMGHEGLEKSIESSIRGALQRAQMKPMDIGHVNAHGLSTIEEDAAEATAIANILGDTPVTAPKSFFGNLGAGGGAVEAVASFIALGCGEIPYVRNFQRPDPKCPANMIKDQCLSANQNTALLLNQAGTGQSYAMVIAGP